MFLLIVRCVADVLPLSPIESELMVTLNEHYDDLLAILDEAEEEEEKNIKDCLERIDKIKAVCRKVLAEVVNIVDSLIGELS